MKKKMNKFILWGLLINSLSIAIKQFIEIPDAFACFTTGMGISLLIFGLYVMNNDITKLKNWKNNRMKSIIFKNLS